MHLSEKDMRLCAIVIIDPSKLKGNVTPSNDSNLLGNPWEIEDLVTDDGMLCSLDRQLGGLAPCCYQYVLCLYRAAITSPEHITKGILYGGCTEFLKPQVCG